MDYIKNHGNVKIIFKGSCFDYGFHAFIDANGDFVIGEERGREGGELYRGKYLGINTPKLCFIKTENPILYNNIVKYFSENKSIDENTIMPSATMKNNNQLLAEKIYEIENAHWKQIKEWHQNDVTKWKITDKIYMEVSDDCMCWYLWKYDDRKCEYGFFKVVPKVHCDKKAIEEILNAQHWVWI